MRQYVLLLDSKCLLVSNILVALMGFSYFYIYITKFINIDIIWQKILAKKTLIKSIKVDNISYILW